MDNTVYWLWLQKCLGVGTNNFELISRFETAKAIYDLSDEQRRKLDLFSSFSKTKRQAILEKMNDVTLESFDEIFKVCAKNKIHILTPENGNYPKELTRLKSIPCVLFARGDVSCLNAKRKMSVVGTRNATEYGQSATEKIVADLAKNDFVIVSGGAVGIDGLSHKTAMENGSKTILVLGSGHGVQYPIENTELRKEVSKQGVLITEYAPLTPAQPMQFVVRNRLISGLSRGLIIIEAGAKSGTLNTAKHATEQEKDIFVLPGDIKSSCYVGSNKLISNGAKAIFNAKDIFNYYSFDAKFDVEIGKSDVSNAFVDIGEEQSQIIDEIVEAKKHKKKTKATKKSSEVKEEIKPEPKPEIDIESISNNAKIVYNVMLEGVYQLDEITRNSSLPVNKVLACLTELEMQGIIVSLGANKYNIV